MSPLANAPYHVSSITESALDHERFTSCRHCKAHRTDPCRVPQSAPWTDHHLHISLRFALPHRLCTTMDDPLLQAQEIQLPNCLPLLMPHLGWPPYHPFFILFLEMQRC